MDQHTESIRPISWEEGRVVMLDQRRLPDEEVYNVYCSVDEVAEAIQSMVIRGAPAVGIAAAMGVAVAVHSQPETESIQAVFDSACEKLQATRPTARNLFWALERMRIVFMQARDSSHQELKEALLSEALLILGEDVAVNRRMGNLGQTLIADDSTVLTYCNTGALATGGYGTALGVIRAAVEAGKRVQVVACETRPYLQGARLTCWEMIKEGIPCTLIADNMAGHLMANGRIQSVIVGADRIAGNGDVANKIGTYAVAVLAKEHRLPFLVAAPLSTIDLATPSGSGIPIEQRPAVEMTEFNGRRIAPAGIQVENPAFDVTPGDLISAVITEAGIARAPYQDSLAALFA